MKNKFKPTVKFSKLSEDSLVQILHMDDYFGEGKPYMGKPQTVKEFKGEVLEEDDLTLRYWYEGSGDGGENFSLLAIVDGEIKVVLP